MKDLPNKSDKIHVIKHLRERTNCGLNTAKQVLEEANWSFETALDILRTRGQKITAEFSNRQTCFGTIKAYIHSGSQLAVMVEVGCETDFCARTPELNNFAEQCCMHIAAMNPGYLSREDPDPVLLQKLEERFVLHSNELPHLDTEIKRDHFVKAKKINWFVENCLLDQKWIHDSAKSVGEVVNELTLSTREKIAIKRWVRWHTGE